MAEKSTQTVADALFDTLTSPGTLIDLSAYVAVGAQIAMGAKIGIDTQVASGAEGGWFYLEKPESPASSGTGCSWSLLERMISRASSQRR